MVIKEMINKFMTADEAVAGVKDGMTIMVGGFLGTGLPRDPHGRSGKKRRKTPDRYRK